MNPWKSHLLKVLTNENDNGIMEIKSGVFTPYSAIVEESLALAARFPGHGKVVSVYLRNSREYIVCYLASVFSGSVFAPIPHNISKFELPNILKYQESRCFIHGEEDTIDLGAINLRNDFDTYSFEQIKSKGLYFNNQDTKSSDIGFLYYSSGTTGNPKGILYSYGNKLSLITAIVKDFSFSRDTRHLALLPFGHTASLNYSVFPSLYCASNLYISEGYAQLQGALLKTLSDFKINYVQLVPTIIQSLISFPEKAIPRLSENLKFIGCGSAPLFVSQQIEFERLYGVPVANLYGLSETGPTHIDNPLERDWSPGSIGYPLSVNECRLSSDGEIQIKGPNVFAGYHMNATAYSSTMNDGWFSTGDFGELKSGKYYFLDRKKDLIIIGGANVLPAEIEEIVLKHGEVEECAAFGVSDALLGEVPGILVKLREEPLVDSSQISDESVQESVRRSLINLCKGSLSTYKIPKKIFFTNQSLPKTESGKVSRRKCKLVAFGTGNCN